MNFVYYIIAIIAGYFYFWKLIVLFVTGWLTRLGVKKFYQATLQGKTLSRSAMFFIHFYGTTIDCLIYGLLIASITAIFGQVNPWFYYIFGGAIAFFTMVAPSGETSILAMLESLFFYVAATYLLAVYPDWVDYLVPLWLLILSITSLMIIPTLIFAATKKEDEEVINSMLLLPDGAKYVGELKDGKAHGQGTAISPDGRRYIGEYKENRAHGQGTLIFPDGDKYVGEYKNGKGTGQGTYTFADGSKYVGEFKNSKFHGQGVYTFPDGRKYVGQFRNGEPYKQSKEE